MLLAVRNLMNSPLDIFKHMLMDHTAGYVAVPSVHNNRVEQEQFLLVERSGRVSSALPALFLLATCSCQPLATCKYVDPPVSVHLFFEGIFWGPFLSTRTYL